MGLKRSTGFGRFVSVLVDLVVLAVCSWVGFIRGFFRRVLGSSGVCFRFSVFTVAKCGVSLEGVTLVWVSEDSC